MFWLECTSQLVVQAFKNVLFVPWKICDCCKEFCLSYNAYYFSISHVFKEDNGYVVRLISIDLDSLISRDSLPSFVREDVFRNKNSCPNNRFC